MMHQSLYRKYRPSTFSEVFGQSHITEPLQQQLKEEKIVITVLHDEKQKVSPLIGNVTDEATKKEIKEKLVPRKLFNNIIQLIT